MEAALLEFIQSFLQNENRGEKLKELGTIVKEVFQLNDQRKNSIIRASA